MAAHPTGQEARSAALALLLLAAVQAPPAAAQAPPALPDLAPEAARPLLGNLTEGAAAVFEVRVANLGDAPAPAHHASVLLDGAPFANVSLPAIAPGETANATTPPWTAALGNHTLTVVVDAAGAVNESDEGNNALEVALAVQPRPPELPDLLVLDVGPVAEPQVGRNATFKARVLNAGGAEAGAFVVRFELDGRALGNVSLPLLPPGVGITVSSAPWAATGGDHTIRAIADATGAVPEEEERNNEYARAFAAAPPRFEGPDLRVSEVLLDPPHPVVGARVTFTALVENGGTDVGPFEVRFVLDNQTLGKPRNRSGLGAGESVLVEGAPWNATAGTHELVVEAEAKDGNDTARLNNAMPFRFRIPRPTQRPDLVLDLVVVPATIGEGDRVRFGAVVRNNGSWPSDPTEVRFAVDGDRLGMARLEALQPGQTARLTGPVWNASDGEHAVTVRVDPEDQVPELDETDNHGTRHVRIPHGAVENASVLPDLVASRLAWDPLEPKPGQQVVLRATVENRGNRTVGAFLVEFLLDGQVLDRQPVSGVGTAEVVVASRPWTADAGRHTLGVRVDATDLRREQEEGNNLAFAVVDVQSEGLFSAKPVPAPPPAALLALLGLAAAAAAPRALRRR